MAATVIRIFDYLRARRGLWLTVLLLVTAALAVSLSRQHYKEDISDFLPLGSNYGQGMKVYQEISGASLIVAIVAHADTCRQRLPETLTAAIDGFTAAVREEDTTGVALTMTAQVDMEQMEATARFVWANMPYFLTDSDYVRMDSLLAKPGYVASQIAAAKQMLLLPVGSMMAESVEEDPLQLFTPVMASLQRRQPSAGIENYDGYIFTADMSRALVIMRSPYGSSETRANEGLLRFLKSLTRAPRTGIANPLELANPLERREACCPATIRFTGGPVIAVGNAKQIKADSLLAISLALLLIAGLLLAVFRSARSLLLIVTSIAWGWLFAMGALALLRDEVSVIVVGISSVIIGIAVNYPLHLMAHQRHCADMRQALRETAPPLIVGNITTVGAFLALVPLKSVALRDLGLFSSLLLVGTILFVLIFLPQMVASRGELPHPCTSPAGDGSCPTPGPPKDGSYPTPAPTLQGRRVTPPSHKVLCWGLAAATIVLGYFSLQTTFDANIAHINYMTEEQRQDAAALASLQPVASTGPSEGGGTGIANPLERKTVYVVTADSTFDAALARAEALFGTRGCERTAGGSCLAFICSQKEQRRRLALWKDFAGRHGEALLTGIRGAAKAEGFADGAFDSFLSLLHADSLQPQPINYFSPLTATLFAANLAVTDNGTHGTDSLCNVITAIDIRDLTPGVTPPLPLPYRGGELPHPSLSHCYAFDIEGMNSAIATSLADDFNYIGWACGLIVFLFLWLSMGSVELALLSFVPMAVSWVWILGLMSIFGIHFNVVNIILATFIFGQGDDYTIFITEGCQHEYAYRRPMLAGRRQSIILSALIMFIGIGTLIFARHPALRSLGQLTIVGMSCVVLMAWLLPPLIFRWLVADGEGYRRRPLSLSLLWLRMRGEKPGSRDYLRHLVIDRYRYKGLEVTRAVARNLKASRRELPHPCPSPAREGSYPAPAFPGPSEGVERVSEHPLPPLIVTNCGWGERALLLALEHPERKVIGIEDDEDKLCVARHSAEGLADNIIFLSTTQHQQTS